MRSSHQKEEMPRVRDRGISNSVPRNTTLGPRISHNGKPSKSTLKKLSLALASDLSFPKIISARSDDAIRIELVWRQWSRIVGRLVVAARPCAIPGALASDYNRANTRSNAVRRRSGHDPSSRAGASRSGFDVWILPGRLGCARAVANPHRADARQEGLSVGAIIVAHQIGRRRVPRECLHDLLRQPLRRRVPGHCKPE
jgi:hypothetical protein